MKKRIIVDIPFNIDLLPYCDVPACVDMYKNAFVAAQTRAWIAYRMEIFMKYTGNSLIHQTDQSFVCLMRYTKATETIIQEELAKYPKLPDNIIFTPDAEQMMKDLLKDSDYLYHVRIDADNMYDRDFIKRINEFPYEEGLECILCQKGYVYETNKGKLAWIDHLSPSFYAFIYKKEDYFNIYGNRIFTNHYNALKLKYKVLDGYNYMIVIHKNNLSNFYERFFTYCHAVEVEDVKAKKEIFDHYNIHDQWSQSL